MTPVVHCEEYEQRERLYFTVFGRAYWGGGENKNNPKPQRESMLDYLIANLIEKS